MQLSQTFRSLLVALTLAAMCASSSAVAPQTMPRNSLGVAFLKVPGVEVKFAQWETRVSDFAAFVSATGYDWKEKPFFSQTGDHPVVNVNLSDARAFCDWLTKSEHASGALAANLHYRLPTNREWDVAAGCQIQKAGLLVNPAAKMDTDQTDIFPWGRQWPPPLRAGNFNSVELRNSDDGFEYTAPVGSFDADAKGLFDMAGNVWEWTSDGDDEGSPKATLRGGSWQYFRRECLLSSYRYFVPDHLRRPSIGFRCVLADVEEPARQRSLTELRSNEMIARPAVSQQEVEKMKSAMMRNREGSGGESGRYHEQNAPHGQVSDAEKFANWSRLVQGGAGKDFINSLGITFAPSPSGTGLRAARELRSQDLTAWRAEQPDTLSVSESDVGMITGDQAVAFSKWLTAFERGKRKIPLEFAYRVVPGAGAGLFYLELSTTNQSATGN